MRLHFSQKARHLKTTANTTKGRTGPSTSLLGEVDQPLAKSEPGSRCQQQWDLHATHGEKHSKKHSGSFRVSSDFARSLGGSLACEMRTSSIDSSYLALLRYTDTFRRKQEASHFVSGHMLSSQVFVHAVESLLNRVLPEMVA